MRNEKMENEVGNEKIYPTSHISNLASNFPHLTSFIVSLF